MNSKITAILVLVLLLNLTLVLAQETPKLTVEPRTGLDKLLYDLSKLFSSEALFTIVGQDNHASVTPKCVSGTIGNSNECYIKVPSGTSYFRSNSVTNDCPGASAFYDVFSATSSDGWIERFETIDKASFSCSSNNLHCKVQIYCMPYKYPPTEADCIQDQGVGSKPITKSKVDSVMPLKNPDTGTTITSYTYCSEGCTGDSITCWRQGSPGTCESRTYSCGYETYPFCPSSYPYGGPNGKQNCLNSLPSTDGGTGDDETPEITDETPSEPRGVVEGNTCGDGKCSGGENYNSCPADCDVIVSNIRLYTPDKIGGILEPFFDITVKNMKDFDTQINVEAGYYTQDYATEVAALPRDTLLGSIFSVVTPTSNCEVNEGFVKTVNVKLGPNEEKTVSITKGNDMIFSSYVTLQKRSYIQSEVPLVAFAGAYETCCQVKSGGGCEVGTGGYQYYKTQWGYSPTADFRLSPKSITCNGEEYGKLSYSLLGQNKITITRDYRDCISKEFLIRNLTQTEIEQELTESGDSFIKIKKLSLTKDEISKVTIQDLLASACLGDSECLPRENKSVSCTRMNRLKEEGLIGESEINDLTNKAKSSLGGAAIGGGAVLTTCAITGVVTGGVGLVACGVGGALLGAATGYGLSEAISGIGDIFNKDDELTKAIKSGDSTKYGICVAETPSFDIGGILKSIGKAIKITGNETTDGIIIVVIGFFLLITLLGALGGKR